MKNRSKTEKDFWESVRSDIPEKNLNLGRLSTHNLLSGKHMFFSMARYKFASKMVGNNKTVLDLGCNEGLGEFLFLENNCSVLGVDFDDEAIKWAKKEIENSQLQFLHSNFLGEKFGTFDAVVALDVIEHILPTNEAPFLDTIRNNLSETGVCLIGTPNINAKKYASEASQKGHINDYSAERLKETLITVFKNVFIFSMNDEVVHTGFYPMSHYLIALACNPREKQ